MPIHHFLMGSFVVVHPGYPSTFNGFVSESMPIHQFLMGFVSESVGDSACFYIRGAVRQKFLQSDIHSWRGHSSGQMYLILVVVIGILLRVLMEMQQNTEGVERFLF